MIKKNVLFLLALILVPIFLTQTGQSISTDIPVVDILDLMVDGSGAGGVNVSVSKDFTVITRLVAHLEFAVTTFNLNDFGSNSPLTNGIKVFMVYNNEETEFTDQNPIKTNDDWGQYGYDLIFLSDERNPKDWLMLSRFTFTKLSPNGLDNRTGLLNSFFFQVNDNLTAGLVTHLTIAIEGYRNVVTQYFSYINEPIYNGVISITRFEDLIIGNTYNLKISDADGINIKWVNFTAIDNNMYLEFQFDTNELNEYDSIIILELYNINDVLLDTDNRILKVNIIQIPYGLLSIGIFIIMGILIMFFGFAFLGSITNGGKVF